MDRRLIFCEECNDNKLGIQIDPDPRHKCVVCRGYRTGPHRSREQWAEVKARKDAERKREMRARQALRDTRR